MAVRMAEAQRAPWRQRLEGLGFSAEDKGILISLLMAMKPVDREMTVDTDAQVAAGTLKHMLLVAGGEHRAAALLALCTLCCPTPAQDLPECHVALAPCDTTGSGFMSGLGPRCHAL